MEWNPGSCTYMQGKCSTALLHLQSLADSYQAKIFLPYDSASMLLPIYPNELKSSVYTKTHTKMLMWALPIIGKLWYPDNGILFINKEMSYQVIKKINCVLLNERSQPAKAIAIWYMWHFRNDKFISFNFNAVVLIVLPGFGERDWWLGGAQGLLGQWNYSTVIL
jgi:hypothetical protein